MDTPSSLGGSANLWYQGTLHELTRPECLELLRSVQVGRIAFHTEDGPVVFPVNHVMDDADVLFRTNPASLLGRRLLDGPVAFEVDHVDAYNQSGWSVLVQGRASYAEPDSLPRHESERPVPWPAGVRTAYVRIHPTEITGRRLLAT
jgi:nitroimidazol reductase NimA-like FMN-containing flavoprotein (pyridoxamine 5'-phosphate oxidase superfamily)